MSNTTPTINVRHRPGLAGRLMIRAIPLLNRVGIRVPLGMICFVLNWSSFVSVAGGPWQRMTMDFTAAEFA
jgi:hypothetical protein